MFVNPHPPLANTAKFIFGAQSPPKPLTNDVEISTDDPMDPIDFPLSCKRARENGMCSTDSVRRGQPQSARRDRVLEGGSFKTKLMGSSNPGEWSGFGSGNPPVSINEDDIVYGEGEFGPSMKLSMKLKEKLAKPWSNASGKDGVGSSAAPSGPSGNGGSVNKDQGAAKGGIKTVFDNYRKKSSISKKRGAVNSGMAQGSRFDVLLDDLREGNEILFDKKSKVKKPMSSTKGGPNVDGKKVVDDISNKVENPGKVSDPIFPKNTSKYLKKGPKLPIL
ncbi:hypothetical protein ACOSQ3_020831 [Xanthoceras sorbifolium]